MTSGRWVAAAAGPPTSTPRGQVVGYSEIASGAQHPFLWDGDVMTDLGSLGGGDSSATAINDRGQVVGVTYRALRRMAACFPVGRRSLHGSACSHQSGTRLHQLRSSRHRSERHQPPRADRGDHLLVKPHHRHLLVQSLPLGRRCHDGPRRVGRLERTTCEGHQRPRIRGWRADGTAESIPVDRRRDDWHR